MAGSSSLKLLLAVALCLSQTGALMGLEGSNASVTLPTWKPNAEYITSCDFNSDQTPFCGWTHFGWTTAEGSYLLREDSLLNPFGLTRLESDLLNLSGVFCLEFWYRAPGSNGTDLKVLIKDDAAETEIWTSQATGDDSWQRVFLPLSYVEEAAIQVVFEAALGRPGDGEVTLDNVGVRRGPCGEQCAQGEFWADDACSTQCGCSTPGGQLTCSPASCPEDHICGKSGDAPACLPSFGTCSLLGNPHLSTFDGANFRFTGICTYVLAKVCTDSAPVPFFRVEAHNEKQGDYSTAPIQQVNVELQGLMVSLLKKEMRKVMVNGIWRSLPQSLDSGSVTISSIGTTIILETDFKLKVSYNAADGVQVKVPAQYADQVCGLCGNFNHLTEDDHTKPDGSRAVDGGELGQSWQTEGDTCEAAFLPHRCPLGEEAKYESKPNCGAILSKEGPFAACSSVISPEAFFRSCVFDMCASEGDPRALCKALQTFAAACQSAGITLPPWRNTTVCPLVCQPNSHYNKCPNGCPATCSDQDIPESCGVCEERCDCDAGFLLSGGKCVPAEDCGCWINGQHIEKGATVMKGDCELQCQCMGRGKVQCSPASCSQDEVCRVENGIAGCFTPSVATCHVFGDPHYLTYDGKLYNFQGACNYTLAKTCGHSPVQFTVTGRNENRGSTAWAALNSIALEVRGLHLALRKEKEVYVNGILAQLPLDPISGVKVFLKGPYVQVETDFGLQLLFDGDHRLFLRVDERYHGVMCGLCGTYSNNQFDDFLTPDGMTVSNANVFGNSWRVKDEEWPCLDSSPVPTPCEPQLENEGYQVCSVLLDDLFKSCHGFVPVQLYMNSCMYDHCATLGSARQLCTSLESYAAACELAEVHLGDWRQNTICANFTPQPTDISTTTSRAVCPLDCNFDNSECGWQQLVTDSFDWLKWQGSTPTDLTGPSHDHTTGGGSYMYIEGDGVYHGDSARMLSPHCQAPGPHCLRFWYHMYGSARAMSLNMYQLQGTKVTKIWSKVNNQGNAWHKAEVDIDLTGPFQVIMEGIRGSDQRSDMAFDDVSFFSGKCSDSSNSAQGTTVVPTSPSMGGAAGKPHPVCRLDCNFESDLCTWNQLLTDSFDWTWLSGSTPTLMTGPSFDHTTGAGHYLYIEGDGVYNGDTARLLSSECPDSGPQCLQFWYHVYGTADTMGLTVYQLEGITTQRLWSRRNDRGDAWHRAQVDLKASGAFRIIFEGRRGTDALSDVALDDVSLHRGTCADLIVATTPKPPVQTTTTIKPPVQTTTIPQPPVQTTTTIKPPVQTTTIPQPPVQTTTIPQPPVQTTTTIKPPVQTTTIPKPPVQTTTIPQPPVQTTTTIKPPVQTTTIPQPPVQTTTTPQPPVQTTTTPQPPVETTTLPGPSCPRNSHHTGCKPKCEATCQDLHATRCLKYNPCSPGCICDDGFVLKWGKCVPIQTCGCLDDDGQVHRFGESWTGSHCTQKCRCTREQGEGEINCNDYECGGHEICHLGEEGEFKCKYSGFSECTIVGDPEYRTFDNRKHDFEGKRSYILVRANNLPDNLPEVYVEGINRPSEDDDEDHDSRMVRDDDSEEDSDSDESHEDDHTGRLRGLRIRVYNHTIEFKAGRVLVLDGERVRSPVSLAPGLKVLERSSRIYVKTDFGLSVEFDGHSRAEIILPSTYKKKVEGLCGNYDGKKRNDLMKPDGTQAKNVQDFGESWRATLGKRTIRQR